MESYDTLVEYRDGCRNHACGRAEYLQSRTPKPLLCNDTQIYRGNRHKPVGAPAMLSSYN